METENFKLKAARLHRNYIILILIIIIAIMLTIFANGEQKLYENVSFAATLSSLLLSVVAIIYTLQTSGSLASTLKKIQKTSKILKTTSHKIEQSNTELGNKVDSIPVALASMQKSVDQSKTILEEHAANLFKNDTERENSQVKLPDHMIVDYIRSSYSSDKTSWRIILELYEKDLRLDIERFNEYEKDLFTKGAFYSTLFSAADLQIIEVAEIESPAKDLFTIDKINNEALETLKNENIEFEKNNQEKFRKNSLTVKDFINDITPVDIN